MFKQIKNWWHNVYCLFNISFGFMYCAIWFKFHIVGLGFDVRFSLPDIFFDKEFDKWLYFKSTDYKKLRSCHNLNLYNKGYTGLSLSINKDGFLFNVMLLGLWYFYTLESIEKHYED